MIKIYKCGERVSLTGTDYIGVITCVTIRDSKISYGISYFEQGIYKENYFCDYEFTVLHDKPKKTIIGFIDKD